MLFCLKTEQFHPLIDVIFISRPKSDFINFHSDYSLAVNSFFVSSRKLFLIQENIKIVIKFCDFELQFTVLLDEMKRNSRKARVTIPLVAHVQRAQIKFEKRCPNLMNAQQRLSNRLPHFMLGMITAA